LTSSTRGLSTRVVGGAVDVEVVGGSVVEVDVVLVEDVDVVVDVVVVDEVVVDVAVAGSVEVVVDVLLVVVDVVVAGGNSSSTKLTLATSPPLASIGWIADPTTWYPAGGTTATVKAVATKFANEYFPSAARATVARTVPSVWRSSTVVPGGDGSVPPGDVNVTVPLMFEVRAAKLTKNEGMPMSGVKVRVSDVIGAVGRNQPVPPVVSEPTPVRVAVAGSQVGTLNNGSVGHSAGRGV
jgi:hypothetical protein